MDKHYQDVLARIVKDRAGDGRGIWQQTDLSDVTASLNMSLQEEGVDHPHYTEVQEELQRLGMSKEHARDVTLVFRALKFVNHGSP